MEAYPYNGVIHCCSWGRTLTIKHYNERRWKLDRDVIVGDNSQIMLQPMAVR